MGAPRESIRSDLSTSSVFHKLSAQGKFVSTQWIRDGCSISCYLPKKFKRTNFKGVCNLAIVPLVARTVLSG